MKARILTTIGTMVALMFGLITVAAAQSSNAGPNCDELDSIEELHAAIVEYGHEAYDNDGDGVACQGTHDYKYGGEGGDPTAIDSAPGIQEGENCNVETGMPGPGEGTINAEGDCISQEDGEDESIPVPDTINTGGGYCALNDC
jgi:hypothetical protein